MMLTSTTPYLDNSVSHSTTHSAHRWPVARCSVSWHRGRLIPTVRCVLVHSDQYAARLGGPVGSAGASGPRQWGNGTSGWVARTKALASALAGTHKAWSTQSMQTLQRVGSMIRSTSLDCIAALGKKGGTPSDQQPQQPEGPEDNDQDENNLVRASLSRFLTAASDAEVSQAARMADLSDMAYNVMDVTPERLQQAHGMELIANSRSSAQASAGLLQGPRPAQQRQLPQHGSLQQQQQQPAPWPMPVALLQHGGAIPAPSTDFNSLPASPRTPFVMASYAEDDSVLGHALEYQAVTASGFVSDPGSPRRPSAAAATAAAAAGGGVAVATMAMPAAPAMGGIPPAYMQPAVIRQASTDFGLQYEVQQDEQLSMDEAALLQQLKQQEAFVLLEMQASQQMMFLLQQSQQQHLRDAGAASAAAHDWQELQGLAAMASSTITAAASTAAAAALASSSSFELAAEQRSPRSSQDAAAVAVAGAPADWFCCDGPLSASDATPTRFFSIQGSITLEHWRINLTIDPCEFERGALGPIKVHRGMYEAALCMYDTLLPLVQQHLAAHPDGKIALTGHSLGGSLATLLMLLMVHRGDLPVANVATTYTFGSPAVFCEGANGASPTPGPCHSCSLPCSHRNASNSSSATDGLLSKLGLAADAVVNVIMTRDIVPRAFVCDYTLVAGVLKSWLPSFKEHKGLSACKEHKALYNFIGVVEVLQPTTDCDFVLPDEGHDMLPPGAALYKLTEPQQQAAAAAGPAAACSSSSPSRKGSFNSLSSLTNISSRSLSSALAELTSSFSLGGSRNSSSNGGAGGDHDDSGFGLGMVAVPVGDSALTAAAGAAELDSPFTTALAEHPQSPAAAIAAAAAPAAAAAKASSARVVRKSPEGLTLGDAILTFMNSPHPLQTLGEMRAYGNNGSISRYHNPASYTKALQKLSKD